jgi:spermidine synthase
MSTEERRAEDWLCEEQTQGARLCLRVNRWLVQRRTSYQELALAETVDHGRVLALDGKVMLSERDEPFYHEMLVHPAMLLHPLPEQVLIVGGGDGGTLREVLHHPSVREAVLVEIDSEVIDVSREFLPSVHQGAFADPRTRVVIAPGERFLPKNPARFDVLLVDSTDPIGPGKALFTEEFFSLSRAALRPGGLLAMQAGTPFYWPEELAAILENLHQFFPCVGVYLGFVPLYPAGMWAYVLAAQHDFQAEEKLVADRFAARGLHTRYYTPALHKAAFILPRFVAEVVAKAQATRIVG